MNIISKALVGTGAAGAMAMASATPAMARDGRGISAGDIIAGALVIGGIAAVASAANRDNGYGYNGTYGGPYNGGYYDRGYNGGYYNNNSRYAYSDPRQAVEACVRAVEANASRSSYGRAKVTDIRDVDNKSYGVKVEGRVAVNQMGRDWRNSDPRYGSGWGNDYRGWNDNYRGYDAGKFTCKVQNGRVFDINYSGIRGL